MHHKGYGTYSILLHIIDLCRHQRRGGSVNTMDYILVLLIVSALVYTLGFRLGIGRGRKESRMKEYRRGYRQGYEHSRREILSRLGQGTEEAPMNRPQ